MTAAARTALRVITPGETCSLNRVDNLATMCKIANMRSYQSGDARLKMREILTAVEQGEHVELQRYDTPTGVIVPIGWHSAAVAAFALIDQALEDMDAGLEWQSVMAALREARRKAGLAPQDPRVVDHIDGNPRNNDPSNLRIMDPKENGR